MIAALARGAAVFGGDVYGQAAAQAAEFIFQKLRRQDGRLLARYRDGESAHFLSGTGFMLGPSREIVIAGKAGHADTEAMLSAIRRAFMPETTVVFHPEGQAGSEIEKLVPFLREQRSIGGKATAYICENQVCQAPVTDYQEFAELLHLK